MENDHEGYPFWGGDRPNYCGHSAFQLTNCQGHVPLITIDSISYRLLSLEEQNQSLTLSRAGLYEENCPTSFFNTTLDSTPFTPFPTNRIVTLLYGCTLVPGQVTPIPNQFNCTANGTISINYFTVEAALVSSNLVLCRNSVTVPVNATSGQALVSIGVTTRDLQVALGSGFGVQWNANNSLCDQCGGSSGRCGSNPDSNSFACYCADGVYDSRCNTTAQNGFSISGAVVIMVIFIIIFFYCKRWFKIGKKEEMDDKNVEAFLRNHGSLTPRRYAYSNIKKMTNSFSDKLGEGGYDSVFKGKLSDGRLLAVKVLNDATGDGVDFVNEASSISRTSHVNIVTLLGFCLEGNKRALVYEFMPNKSLDKFIGNKGSSSLDWETLYQIAVGTARGLEYLHRGCNTRIVHFDIKPENILLDEEFCPKISDFGLAKVSQKKKSIVSMLCARGTPGYIAPEVFCGSFGKVSHKSDVYSYGMMVINMVGVEEKTEVGSDLDSTSETYFPDFIYKCLELVKGLGVFQGLKSEEEEETARKMVMVSLWCIQTNPLDRPSMSKVVEMLEGSIESLQVPPKPFLFSLIRANQDSCSALSGSCEIE